MKKARRSLKLSTKKSLYGVLFALPFIFGFIFLFLSPFLLYVNFSFSDIYPGEAGTGMVVESAGWENYRHVLFVQSGYIRSVVENLGLMLVLVPSILIYSFIFASILNQKFKGRTFARAIFFLPVIISSGAALAAQQDALMTTAVDMLNDPANDSLNMTEMIMSFFGTSLSPAFFDVVSGVIDQVVFIISSGGVQIIIFLAALQTIPSSLYEASSIEGATAWENFWKITLPMISPMILVCAVYTIIDQLSGMSNKFVENLYTLATKNQQYGLSAAMGLMYFAIVLLILGLVVFLVSKAVFYENR